MGISILNSLTSASNSGREVLPENRQYYVATTGSDSNSGLSAGAAFLTIQKAIDTACGLDLSVCSVTINIANGTYAGCILKSYIGVGPIHLKGNESTPANVVIGNNTGTDCINAPNAGYWKITGVHLVSTTGWALYAYGTTFIEIGNISFGANASGNIFPSQGARITAVAPITMSGTTTRGIYTTLGGGFIAVGQAITISGTVNFSTAFAHCTDCSYVRIYNTTFTGSATGVRYKIERNGVCFVAGAGADYFPGSTAGSTVTGGIYE